MINNINQYIDYTCIKPGKSTEDLIRFVNEGIDANYRALVLHPDYLAIANNIRKERKSNIKIATVWGFPWDMYDSSIYKYIDLFDEIDIVLPEVYCMSAVCFRNLYNFKEKFPGKLIKVIIETLKYPLKDRELEIKERILKAEESGADIIKTNTGLITRKEGLPTLEEDVLLIKKYTSKPIKAAGGIRTLEQCVNLINLGVSIIGTSTRI